MKPLRLKQRPLKPSFFVLLVLLPIFSCQTFGLKKPVPKPTGSFRTTDMGKYSIRVDLLSSSESKEYFGIDLFDLGIQIINLGIENKTTSVLRLNLDDIFVRDMDNYLYRPLPLNDLARRIYDANKYQEMVNYGAKKGALYGISGAIIAAVTSAITGGKVGTSAAVGGWVIGTIKAVEGAEDAKGKATKRITEDLGTLMIVPGSIPQATKVGGLLFFAVEQGNINSLEVRLAEQDTREKLKLTIEMLRTMD